MSVQIVTKTETKQKRIFNILTGLVLLPKVSIERINNLDIFEIKHNQQFVPNFRFEWCSIKEHYRVYIKVESKDTPKVNTSYCIYTISNSLVANGFVTLYNFLHKIRANKK